MRRLLFPTTVLLTAVLAALSTPAARAESGPELQRNAAAALKRLYASDSSARLLGGKARAILVFPSILKAGFLFGGQIGEGVLLRSGRADGYYNSVAASYGLQAGVQVFGYALFFMNQDALTYLNDSNGWEMGSGAAQGG